MDTPAIGKTLSKSGCISQLSRVDGIVERDVVDVFDLLQTIKERCSHTEQYALYLSLVCRIVNEATTDLEVYYTPAKSCKWIAMNTLPSHVVAALKNIDQS